MTREEAIDMCMEVKHYLTSGNPIWDKDKVGEAIDMAIEALKRERTDEWCTDCKEYDTEKKCCPRFNRVIRGAFADALDAMPSADRPRGEWIHQRTDVLSYVRWNIWECSACHEKNEYESNFCPNCGADMRGEEE